MCYMQKLRGCLKNLLHGQDHVYRDASGVQKRSFCTPEYDFSDSLLEYRL